MCRKRSMTRLGKSRTSRRSASSSSSLPLSPSSSCSTAEKASNRRTEGAKRIMARLDGRVAILTGGAKGIGKHYARALAAEGARLMIADIADGSEVAAALARDYGANSVESVIADVSDEGAVRVLIARTIERFDRIDVLVNNAALFTPLHETKCTDIDVDTWDRVMAINLRGPFLLVKHVVPRMSAQGYGKIINI